MLILVAILGVLVAIMVATGVIVALSYRLKGELKAEIAVDFAAQNVVLAAQNVVLDWVLAATPERVDFWHTRAKTLFSAPKSRGSIREEAARFYGQDPKNPSCAVTGLTGQVTAAHLLPRNSVRQAYWHFDLDPNKDRDSERMIMFMCEDIEKAFDKKQISFAIDSYEGGNAYFVMKIWDPSLKGKQVRRCTKDENEDAKLKEKVPKFEEFEGVGNKIFKFSEKATPYTRILSYHHRVCYFNAFSQGWLQKGAELPDSFGTPLGMEIRVSTRSDLESYHEKSNSNPGTPHQTPSNKPSFSTGSMSTDPLDEEDS